MFYINTYKRKFVNSVNMLSKKRLTFDYAVNDKYSFSLLDKQGQKLNINADDIFYIAADVNFDLTDTPCFYSTDYVIEDNIITFTIDTYTDSFLEKVKSEDTELYIEIGIKNINDDSYKIILHDVINAMPRIYVNGTPPTPIEQYYTKDEVDTALSVKADIDDIPNKTSQLQNDSGYITIEQVPTVDLTDYYTKDEVDNKLENITIDTTDFYTKSEIDTALSVKADVSELNNYQLKSEAFSGDYNDLINKPDISGKLDRSGKNQMIVDEGVFTINAITSFDINAPFSSFAGGKVVCYDGLGVMNEITLNSNSPNTAGGLVVVGSNGKIPENLYDKTEVDLTPYALKSEIPVVDVNKAYVDAELAKKLNSADAFSGSYNDLTDVPEIPVVPDNITTQGNVFNGANQLVKTDDTGKIPSELYDTGSSTEYTAGNGIAITDGVIAVKNSGYNVYTDTYRIRAIKEGETSNNTYHQGEILLGSNANNKGIEITWRESTKYSTDSSIYLRKTTGITMYANGGIRANNIYVDAKVANGGTVSTSYVARYENTGNIHTISLTAATDCTLTVSGIPTYATLMVIVDNAAGGSLLFGSEEVISNSETGKYALVFSNLGSSVKLYNKIEV